MKRGTGNTLDFTYDATGRPTAVTLNGTLYYYVTNLQGDVIAIVDTTGATVVQYTYDAWGKNLGVSGTLASTLGQYNPLRYRGYVYDQETGLYYLQSRYYDPGMGRFINADVRLNVSLGILGVNQFCYCLNNPVNMTDYCGNKPGDLFDTMDEAAIDFAEYCNATSISLNREFGSFIYKVYVYQVQDLSGNSIYYSGSSYTIAYCQFLQMRRRKTYNVKFVKKVMYTYVTPAIGNYKSVIPPTNCNTYIMANYFYIDPKMKVAEIHTHAAYYPEFEDGNDTFSPRDRDDWINYLVTPLGTLLKYIPGNVEDIIICDVDDGLPFDPNHPGRR